MEPNIETTPALPEGALACIAGVMITRPARHGLVLEWAPAPGQRVMLRLWTYEQSHIAGHAEPAEMPKPLAAVDGLKHLRTGMETLREWMVTDPSAAAADMQRAGIGMPELIREIASLRTEPLKGEEAA